MQGLLLLNLQLSVLNHTSATNLLGKSSNQFSKQLSSNNEFDYYLCWACKFWGNFQITLRFCTADNATYIDIIITTLFLGGIHCNATLFYSN